MMSTLTGVVGFIEMAFVAFAFFARHDSMLIAGAVLIGSAAIAAAVERPRDR
jgi:hypothetical protein